MNTTDLGQHTVKHRHLAAAGDKALIHPVLTGGREGVFKEVPGIEFGRWWGSVYVEEGPGKRVNNMCKRVGCSIRVIATLAELHHNVGQAD